MNTKEFAKLKEANDTLKGEWLRTEIEDGNGTKIVNILLFLYEFLPFVFEKKDGKPRKFRNFLPIVFYKGLGQFLRGLYGCYEDWKGTAEL